MRCVIACAHLCTRLKQRHAKKHALLRFKKLQSVWKITRLNKQRVLTFTFYKTHRSYKKIMCIYLLFHKFSGENCITFTFSLHKE